MDDGRNEWVVCMALKLTGSVGKSARTVGGKQDKSVMEEGLQSNSEECTSH